MTETRTVRVEQILDLASSRDSLGNETWLFRMREGIGTFLEGE